jgi:hypothetical protein
MEEGWATYLGVQSQILIVPFRCDRAVAHARLSFRQLHNTSTIRNAPLPPPSFFLSTIPQSNLLNPNAEKPQGLQKK